MDASENPKYGFTTAITSPTESSPMDGGASAMSAIMNQALTPAVEQMTSSLSHACEPAQAHTHNQDIGMSR